MINTKELCRSDALGATNTCPFENTHTAIATKELKKPVHYYEVK